MRLQELFLVETTEEDRALISLSSAIYNYIQKYEEESVEPEYDGDDFDDEYDDFDSPKDEKVIMVGNIGSLFNTPIDILNPITIELQSSYGIRERLDKEDGSDVTKGPTGEVLGIWYGANSTMVLNKDYLTSNAMKTTITHELRHALDDYKSNFQANKIGGRYSIPRNKAYRDAPKHPELGNVKYLAEPAEINARFLQVLHAMVPIIRRAAALEPNRVRPAIMSSLQKHLEARKISSLFPEKEKSKDYKRLMKRAMDFIEKELKYVQSSK